MDVKTIHRYTRPDGGITVSPDRPECEYQTLYRIVASDGLGVRKGDGDLLSSIDTEDANGWVEEVLPPTPVPVVELPAEYAEPETQEETPLEEEPVTQTPEESHSASFSLSPEEYLEWKDYKSRLSTLEYQLSLIVSALTAKGEPQETS